MTASQLFPYVLVRRAQVSESALASVLGVADADQENDAASFDRERKRTLALAAAEPLRSAIVGSSSSFLAHMDRPHAGWDKRARHAAQTAHRYVVRAAKKVSPFGRFAAVELGEAHDESTVSCTGGGTASSWVEVGSTIARALTRRVRTRAAHDPLVPLRWNPTLAWQGGSLVCVTPTETGARLVAVAPVLASHLDCSVPPAVWMEDAVGEDAPRLRRKLVDGGIAEWDAHAPDGSTTSALALVSEDAERLHQLSRSFGEAESTTARLEIIREAEERLPNWMPDEAWKTTDVFAEDRFGGVRHGFARETLEAYMRDVRALARAALVGGEPSAAFREWIDGVLAGEASAGLMKVLDAAMKLSDAELPADFAYEASRSTESATFSQEGDHVVLALAPDLTSENEAHLGSLGAWIAVGTDTTGQVLGALTAVARGYGRGFGRFLRGLPSELLARLRRRNADAARDRGLFEVPSSRQADAHPYVGLPALRLPGYVEDSACRGDGALFMRDLRVVRTASAFELHHTARGRLRVVDLRVTSLSPSRLEWLVRLLAGEPAFDVPDWLAKARRPLTRVLDGDVLFMPRVVSISGLVLARRRWIIPMHTLQLASLKSDEQRRDAYLALTKRLKLPAEHFATLPASVGRSRSSHKPRYIHSESFLAVDDLVRTWRREPGRLVVEEAYPAHGLLVDGERFTAELYVEDDK